jgi:hypothetical protein
LIYASGTATNVPLAANLTSSASGAELALNYADGKLYFKNSSGVVTLLAGSGGGGPAAGSNTQLQFNSSGVFGASANLTWSGTVLATTGLTATGAILHNTTTNNQSYTTTGAGAITISSGTTGTIDGMNIGATTAGTGRFSSITNTGLTSGRVVYSTTGGLETDSANLTFDGTNLGLAGGTANGVAYLNGSKVLTTGSALTFDGTVLTGNDVSLTTGRSGVALTGKYSSGFPSSGAGYFQLKTNNSDGTNGGIDILTLSAGTLRLAYSIVDASSGTGYQAWNVAGSEQMRLTSTGLGIGTSSPSGKLHVDGGSFNSLTLSGNSTNSVGARFQNSAASSKNWNIGSSGGGPSPAGSFFIYDDTSSATRMVIDSSGNVGIGTSSPTQKLHVNGNLIIPITNSYFAYTTNYGMSTGTGLELFCDTGDVIRFICGGKAGTERIRIDSSGNLLVGRTSQFGSERVSIESASANTLLTTYNFTATSVTHHEVRNQNGVVGSIVASGGSTSYNTSSDYRLKNVTGPITNSGAYIDSLEPCEGTWLSDGSVFVGLIAHKTQEVSRTPIATGVKDGDVMQGMDYSSAEIIANLIAEVKSLRKRLTALESKEIS